MTDIIDPQTVPSTPSPEITALIATLIRHILTFLSGVGVIDGVYSDSTITLLASAQSASPWLDGHCIKRYGPRGKITSLVSYLPKLARRLK